MKTIEMSQKQEKELSELVDASGAKDLTELINKALALYEFKINEEKEGRFLASVDPASKQYFKVKD